MSLFVVLTLALAFFILLVILDYAFVLTEYNYSRLSNKPFYVHYYFKIKKLPPSQFEILNNQFLFYKTLSIRKKKYFEHRVASFIEHYEFIGNEGFVITDEVKVLVASTSVMLTFGMRDYLFDIIDKIIVYPSVYYSTINQVYHKGEFNPQLRVVVFSWEDFKSGYQIDNDNLNLGIHEFCHVVHFNATKNNNVSDAIFSRMFQQIQNDLLNPDNRERLIQSDYFRVYAYTNQYEFLAVIVEHYFESPKRFKQEFPELYKNVSLMLNHKQ